MAAFTSVLCALDRGPGVPGAIATAVLETKAAVVLAVPAI